MSHQPWQIGDRDSTAFAFCGTISIVPSAQTLLARALAFEPKRVKVRLLFKTEGGSRAAKDESFVVSAIAPSDILTPEDLAGRLKVPVSWVREKTRARNKNPLPSFPMGRYVRFNWPDVVKWLQKQARAA